MLHRRAAEFRLANTSWDDVRPRHHKSRDRVRDILDRGARASYRETDRIPENCPRERLHEVLRYARQVLGVETNSLLMKNRPAKGDYKTAIKENAVACVAKTPDVFTLLQPESSSTVFTPQFQWELQTLGFAPSCLDEENRHTVWRFDMSSEFRARCSLQLLEFLDICPSLRGYGHVALKNLTHGGLREELDECGDSLGTVPFLHVLKFVSAPAPVLPLRLQRNPGAVAAPGRDPGGNPKHGNNNRTTKFLGRRFQKQSPALKEFLSLGHAVLASLEMAEERRNRELGFDKEDSKNKVSRVLVCGRT